MIKGGGGEGGSQAPQDSPGYTPASPSKMLTACFVNFLVHVLSRAAFATSFLMSLSLDSRKQAVSPLCNLKTLLLPLFLPALFLFNRGYCMITVH